MQITKNEIDSVREHLFEILTGAPTHIDFADAVADLPRHLRGVKPERQPHTPWRLVEHMRITQWDILQFILDEAYVSPDWPAGYWPDGDAPPDGHAWDRSIESFLNDRRALTELANNPDVDIFAPIPHGTGQTIHREIILAADHTSYHIGQLIILRRLLGAWQ